ncbi:tetratricopeptide repeat protein 36 [Hyla sarda]|uniref:tetratricopeptide repeat protein 36 n=1 Tax=Hyla sarda TaxID=327740 RepID=UPI0024C4389F|nr:tetratricopeptide repeat protein 36 [Hyla sarda]
MCTPNDSAVLHAIFNPSAPFGDICGDKGNYIQEDLQLENRFPADLLEEALKLELSGVKAAESGDLETAVQKFNEAIERLPDWPSAYNNRAQALRLKGDVTGALQDLNHAVELSKGMGIAGRQALVQRGLIFRLRGNDEAAKEDFQKAAQLGSDFARQQLVQLNPYAALCNRMLRDMVKKLQEPDKEGKLTD